MNTTKRIDCGKCSALGEIEAFRGILGGVCFTCAGSGKRTVSARYEAPHKFGCLYDGVLIFTIKARTEAEALRKAVGHWKRHRAAPAFATVKSEAQIAVVAE
jgi:hypothetical protein